MIQRNCLDKRLGAWLIQRAIFLQSRNILNLCKDSKLAVAVTFRAGCPK